MITGKPDATIWSISGELGYRLQLGASSVLTPYVGVDYTGSKLHGFTETGLAAANLDVFESTHNRTATTVGAKLSGALGGVVPELDLGWRHQFGSQAATVDQGFAAIPGSDFTIVSPFEKRDSALVGVSLGGKLGANAEFKVGYQGRFNGDYEAHAGTITLRVLFGGK
jgi:outer membrane autotransporter protein